MSRIIFVLLLLIGSANAQDSTFNSGTSTTLSKGQFYFKVDSSYPRMTFSAELVVYDSMRLIGYQKKDSTLVIIGDSARFIRVLLQSMAWYSKFNVRYPKRDTVKWKPYYQKKKHHPHNTESFQWGGPLPDSLRVILGETKTANTTISGKTYPLKFDSLGNGLRFLGGKLSYDSTDTVKNAITSTKWIRDTLFSAKGFRVWEPTEFYPLWKKALWFITGIILSVLGFVLIEAFRAKEQSS